VTRKQQLREYDAAREGLWRRLTEERRLSATAADRWIVAWGLEAERLAVEPTADYWKRGSRWIFDQLADRKRPPSPPA
jgi:hypothetical protein